MIKRHPTALLLSSTLTIPLLLGGCTQHYEVKEPMSQPCQTVAVHSNTVFYPVQGSIDPSFVFSGAWIENGVVKLKSVSEADVFTNGKNEYSTGTVEMEGDLNLGTEVKESKENSISAGKNTLIGKSTQPDKKSQDKKDGSDILDLTDSFGDPNLDTINAALNANTDMSDLISYARSFIGVLPYKTAGSSLINGTDCSGFTQQVFKKFGISIPRDSRSQYAEAIKISEADLQPGDLIFYGSSPSTIYHVGIYSGNGTIIHNTRTGDFVREHDYHYAKAYGFGRYLR